MNNIIEAIKQIVNEHSMDITLFVSGSLGALVSDNGKSLSLNKKQRVIRMAVGGITAIFSTQLVVEMLSAFTNVELSSSASAGVGFYIGHLGLMGVTKLMLKKTDVKKNN